MVNWPKAPLTFTIFTVVKVVLEVAFLHVFQQKEGVKQDQTHLV